jgi:hypothetical protein
MLTFFLLFTSCTKFLDVNTPDTKISTESVYKDDATATSVLTGLYARMSNNYINGFGLAGSSLYEELSADNLVLFNSSTQLGLTSYFKNALEPTYAPTTNQTYWNTVYQLLYSINTSIEALTGNKNLSSAVSKRLLGEAYFLRAFNYFYLVNLYGDVPLIITSDYAQNSKLGRTSSAAIYSQVVADLTLAESLLDNNYAALDVTKTTNERIRPNLAAVNALQARVYLYQKDYSAAEIASTKLISNSSYSLVSLNAVFLKNSMETIWAIQPVTNGYNTLEGQLYTLTAAGPNNDHPVYASLSLINTFEGGDGRKDTWIKSVVVGANSYPYPAKYKVPFVSGSTTVTEYTIVLRLAEQYLIRAEARNEQGNTGGAVDDLNLLRLRARAASTVLVPNPLPDVPATLTQVQLRSVILQERRVELFAEWGHRWFDLKRTFEIDAAMISAVSYKGGMWAAYKALYPVPVSEILRNSAISQNTGYTN